MRALLYSIREWEATKLANLHASKIAMCCGIALGPNGDRCGRFSSEACGECGVSLCDLHPESCELCDATICGSCYSRHVNRSHANLCFQALSGKWSDQLSHPGIYSLLKRLELRSSKSPRE